MGFDTVIAAFFVIGMILLVAGTTTMGTTDLLEASYSGYAAIHDTMIDRLHTDIEIQDTWISNVTGHVNLNVANTGETKLSNLELWDVIVIENGQASYLIQDEDYIITFDKNIINPGILDPHESIDIELLIAFDSEDDLVINIITENGIVSSAEYVVP